MPNNYSAVIQTPIGKVGIISGQKTLTQLQFLLDDLPLQPATETFTCQIMRELDCYFKNSNFQFTIPFQIKGTLFQKSVWKALQRIPAGKTATYGELAGKLNTSARAIGNACRSNPLPLLIPCHRVVAQRGLGGFSGDRSGKKIAIKQWLLSHECAFTLH